MMGGLPLLVRTPLQAEAHFWQFRTSKGPGRCRGGWKALVVRTAQKCAAGFRGDAAAGVAHGMNERGHRRTSRDEAQAIERAGMQHDLSAPPIASAALRRVQQIC